MLGAISGWGQATRGISSRFVPDRVHHLMAFFGETAKCLLSSFFRSDPNKDHLFCHQSICVSRSAVRMRISDSEESSRVSLSLCLGNIDDGKPFPYVNRVLLKEEFAFFTVSK